MAREEVMLMPKKPVPADSLGEAIEEAVKFTLEEAVNLWYEHRTDRLYRGDFEALRVTVDWVSPSKRADIQVHVKLHELVQETVWVLKGDKWRENYPLSPF